MDWLAKAPVAPGDGEKIGLPELTAWRVLIVDDEEEIHVVTKMALRHMQFDDRSLEFISAYSGQEARDLMREHDDVAIVLMDVVMETENAGLEAVHFIREDLSNRFCRIILRTGHPGQAPENEIITRYDIDDYKEKTELTAKKLFTSIYVALRSYRDVRSLDRTRMGLEKVINASTRLQGSRGIAEFAEGVLEQMAALLQTSNNAFLVRSSGFVSTTAAPKNQEVLASTGRYENAHSLNEVAKVFPDAAQIALDNLRKPGTLFGDGWFVHCIESPSKRHMMLYLESSKPWTSVDRRVLELFSHNVAIGMDNLLLHEQVSNTQRELVLMLGEAIEMRSMEAGKHVHRVAEYSAHLGRLMGLPDEEIENLRLASPLHDVGKIAIEDAILNKPGLHTPDEATRMKEHAMIGAKIFEGRELPVLKAAGILAAEHHENWDGSGYPAGKAGEDIHIFGRIVALADVYDALLSARCYKEAWTLEATLSYIKEQQAQKFDPQLVDLLINHQDEFLAIGKRLAD